MANLTYKASSNIERLFINQGYVLDFSNNSFQEFVERTIGIDIYSDPGYEEYASKGNKLRQILKNEDDTIVITLIRALINYLEEEFLRKNQSFSDYEKKLISDLHNELNKMEGKLPSGISPEIAIKEKFQMISTRSAKFEEMSADEKIKEIVNLFEFLLKKEGRYISVDLQKVSLGFLSNGVVIEYRKKLQCFRHSTTESIEQRKEFNDEQTFFLINFGVLLCNLIHRELEQQSRTQFE